MSKRSEHSSAAMKRGHMGMRGRGPAEKAKDFAEVFEKGDWGYCCGMLHDIGKYSDKFQRRIRGEEIKVDHATAGARVCMELGGMYPFLEMASFCYSGKRV